MKLNTISTMGAIHAKRKQRDQTAQKSAIKITCLNTNATWNLGPLRRAPIALLLGAVAVAALLAMPGTARGQIYVTDFTTNSVGVYNASSGAAINGWSSALS